MNRLAEIQAEKVELRKELEKPNCNLEELEERLQALEQEEEKIRKKEEIAQRLNNGGLQGKTVGKRKGESAMEENFFGTMEYRKAFVAYMTQGKEIPAEYRKAEVTKTSDGGAILPTTIQNRIVEKLEAYGGLYAEVSHTSYAAGMSIPVSTVKPVAQWVSEGSGTDNQKKSYGSVTFAGHKVRVSVAVSLELSVAAIECFEKNLADNVTEAMIKAFDIAIIKGTGNGQPKGIALETPASTVVLDKLNFAKINEIEGAIPSAYDSNAVYVMSKATLFALKGMKDQQGVVAVESVDGKPVYSLLGRRVVISPEMPDYATAKAGEVVAFAVDLSNYVFNFNYAVTVSRRDNWDNENKEIKAVAVADGKMVDTNGLVAIQMPSNG